MFSQTSRAGAHGFRALAIYKSDRTSLNQFLEATRSILHALAGHAQEIEKLVDVDLQDSHQTMSRGTRHIALLYHMVRVFPFCMLTDTDQGSSTVRHSRHSSSIAVRAHGAVGSGRRANDLAGPIGSYRAAGCHWYQVGRQDASDTVRRGQHFGYVRPRCLCVHDHLPLSSGKAEQKN